MIVISKYILFCRTNGGSSQNFKETSRGGGRRKRINSAFY